ncbi:very late factor 1 [Helicoverpa armigera multiple nucleopolyhedrovirus]|uniref:Vlf-1 n=2 Tax=Alphabaculovirus TaxID=558016 RepID=I3XMB4_NPVMB|nr:putative very late expression factor VLF-1 [Mamestra configurata nucleopolyhedrovirus B]YP_009011161.1 vlf-1 [Mamestra brassicae multiple nucleopolyhedrovirus]ACH88620.1 very late factor 1 [Helicoverpa armigera multiple nucleopolyhedrovirus]WNA17478.1 vlf-1 [Alphabaculovirus mabrassicae]AAM95092.1 putative very late expression factor VLF-1 [Mamestra configurata nucleopolyhedrovirus B]AFL64947.1 vlf-1 [Mamestra brassicae multiple nucleopolyhedrovirus]AFP95817.1 vlf-1 [Mamestra brassicae mul
MTDTIFNKTNNVRNEYSFNCWKSKIQSHFRFETIFQIATDRQRCTPDKVRNGRWSKFIFNKPFAPTTLKSYKSRFIKIIYCLIDESHLDEFDTHDLNVEFDMIEQQKLAVDPEELSIRMHELRSVTKETLQLTVNFYVNCMGIEEYRIPKEVMLPRDTEIKNIRNKEKNIVLKNILDTVIDCIKRRIKYLNSDYVHDRGLLRGAIIFCIMLGTGTRINEARQITLENLDAIIKDGKVRSKINLKRKRNRLNPLHRLELAPLILAREIYSKHPTILQISKNTSTPFKDFKRLFEEAGVEMDRPRSNMIRHYLCSNQYNKGIPLQRVAKLMNHSSYKSTQHYLNKFDVDIDDTDDDDGEESTETTSTNEDNDISGPSSSNDS